MIHFDFDDRYQDEHVVGSAISPREGIVLSTLSHALILGLLLFGPEWTILKPDPAELDARQQELERLQREREAARPRFVFVQPRIDFTAPEPPPRAELSDIDRQARAPERAERPTNPLPFSRGNSTERIETTQEQRVQKPEPEAAQAEQLRPEPPQPEPSQQIARALPPAQTGFKRETEIPEQVPPGLRNSLRNLDRYVQNQTFSNPQGGAQEPGSTIQFDTKGIEFGPWLRRFVAAVRRNWFIPQAAMNFHGHVVIQFNIHKNGRITDVTVVKPSTISGFNHAAYNAIVNSSPVEPLPPEYPDPVAFFTVTFYYNEQPPL